MMKSGEFIAGFSSRATKIVNQMRPYREKVTDQTIVKKVLRSLTPKFDHIVAVIEEFKDLSIFSFDELMKSLQAHGARINRSTKKNEEKTFQVKYSTTKYGENNGPESRGRGKRGFCGGRGRGYGRERGRNDGNMQSNDQDGGSNHMTGVKFLFYELDEKQKQKVHLGNTKELLVEGKGMNKQWLSYLGSMCEQAPNGAGLATSANDDSKLWHLRYGHLSINNPKLLGDKGAFMENKPGNIFLLEKHGELLNV
ncbi:hypothetical protein KY290_000644 [Solanum tuberosum]|uniref:Uncharacterized protein n=1 Tax=Solanum tuberosum TaxID=4113 RepID=A0ABQ7WJX6_SOLTU|nr:hypothetical protein KY289_004782 [Solanum tuberosum]KAH0781046.1 hypothetical protein KY290_000644 [Solanum tuberosum]